MKDTTRDPAAARTGRTLTTAALAALALGGAAPAPAQLVPLGTTYQYQTPFLCGTADPARDGQSTADAFASPYDDFEAGSYATSLSLHNTGTAPRRVTLSIAAQGLPDVLVIETLAIPPRQSRRFGCLNFMDEMRDAFPGELLIGQVVQGTVFFEQNVDAIDLTTTHTFSAARRDGDMGGGVSISVTRESPRQARRQVFYEPRP